MPDRPYTLLSCGMSIDGYLGTASPRRLELSNDADFDRVDALRASCDAILVGAATVRNDNPRLLVRSQARRDARTARGLAPSPMKVTVTRRAELDAGAAFFTTGEAEKIVYCASPRVTDARARLEPRATVVAGVITGHSWRKYRETKPRREPSARARQRVAVTTIARMRPSTAPLPNRRARASAACFVASSSRDASRASISFLSGVP
jgi:riboflavin biosynthesis pyrimidine reductase